jgi:hypothetical protein
MDINSLGSSDCSSSSEDSDVAVRSRMDDYGRPRTRPQFRSCGESQVLARAKEFLPIFRDATFRLIEPGIVTEPSADIRLPLEEHQTESDDTSSENSFGVEIDVGMGVFDVNGTIEEFEAKQAGIPIIELQSAEKPEVLPRNNMIEIVDSNDAISQSE